MKNDTDFTRELDFPMDSFNLIVPNTPGLPQPLLGLS